MFLLKLDEVDYRIITTLQNNARASLKHLARKSGVSIPTVRDRIIKLLETGIIKSLTAIVDHNRLSGGLIVFLTLETKLPESKNISELLKNIPEIIEAYTTTGEHDIIMKVFVPDTKALEELINNKINQIPGIEKCKSNFVMGTILEKQATRMSSELGVEITCANCNRLIENEIRIKTMSGNDLFFCSDNCKSIHNE
uniref:Transcriptional regulator (Lrp) n=1 Tax=uncultured marine thaumarchaeote KM3_06_C02 TaxID=1455976 RepID=A0A075G5H3_9ARCH|nr:transcriptional regulator (lrp) [uncultured marine thaumarchaeote KM3_06_C02]